MASASLRSNPFSQFATTMVASALPIRLVTARAWLMKGSTPNRMASPATGMLSIDDKVAG